MCSEEWPKEQEDSRHLLFLKMGIEDFEHIVRSCLISRCCCHCPGSHQRIAQGFIWQRLHVMKFSSPTVRHRKYLWYSQYRQSSIVLSIYYRQQPEYSRHWDEGATSLFLLSIVIYRCWSVGTIDLPRAVSFQVPWWALGLLKIWVPTAQILRSQNWFSSKILMNSTPSIKN